MKYSLKTTRGEYDLEGLMFKQDKLLESQFILRMQQENSKDFHERQQWERAVKTNCNKVKTIQEKIDSILKNKNGT